MGIMDRLRRFAADAVPDAPGKPFLGELATGADDIYRRWQSRPFNPDVLSAKKGGLAIYKKMREDDQIKACLQLKKSAVITSGWEVEGDDEIQTEFIESCFEDMEGTVEGFITSLLSAFDYGFSVHEIIYRYYDAGPNKGLIGLKALKSKSPTRIDFQLDNYGNLLYITQRQDTGVYAPLPPDKFVIYTYQKEFDNYYGESDLKAIYRQWFVKQEVQKYWAIYLERFSIPIITGKTMQGNVTDPQREAFKNLVQNIQAGTSALVPADLSLNILESTRTDRGVFDQAIQSFNVAIARGILIPQLIGLVPQAGVGSYGKSETDLKVFDWVLGTIGKQVSDAINESLVKPLIDINFGVQNEYPEFRLKPIKEEDKAKLVAAWSEAVARGAVTTTLETQKEVRKLLSFPEMEADEETEVETAIENVNDPPMPVIQGKSGNSGLAGGPSKASNVPGKKNQYKLTDDEIATYILRLAGPEARADWEQYVADLDGIEEAAKKELTDAFVVSINGMIGDAKKNSRVHRNSSSPTREA